MPTQADLLKDLMLMQQRLNSIFEDSPAGFGTHPAAAASLAGCWTPAIDCYEGDDKFVITAELAGVSRDDVDLHVRGRKVVLSGERKLSPHIPKENYYRVECPSGKFKRTFEFSAEVDTAHIDARLINGVLRITLPKKQITSRHIPIENAGE
jgi:HSP20 family protein